MKRNNKNLIVIIVIIVIIIVTLYNFNSGTDFEFDAEFDTEFDSFDPQSEDEYLMFIEDGDARKVCQLAINFYLNKFGDLVPHTKSFIQEFAVIGCIMLPTFIKGFTKAKYSDPVVDKMASDILDSYKTYTTRIPNGQQLRERAELKYIAIVNPKPVCTEIEVPNTKAKINSCNVNLSPVDRTYINMALTLMDRHNIKFDPDNTKSSQMATNMALILSIIADWKYDTESKENYEKFLSIFKPKTNDRK